MLNGPIIYYVILFKSIPHFLKIHFKNVGCIFSLCRVHGKIELCSLVGE